MPASMRTLHHPARPLTPIEHQPGHLVACVCYPLLPMMDCRNLIVKTIERSRTCSERDLPERGTLYAFACRDKLLMSPYGGTKV